MALTQIDDRGLKTPIDLLDDEKIRFGTGNDLEIYFNGTNSHIQGKAGDTCLRGDSLKLLNSGASHNYLTATNGGAVNLHYNNIKTFQTEPNGITLLGDEGGDCVLKLSADEGDDAADLFRFVASASGGLYMQNYTSGAWETDMYVAGNAQVQLHHNNLKKFETTSTGSKIQGHLVLENTDQSKILSHTADGSDDNWLSINGGGDASQTRGGGITFWGNEATNYQGKISLSAGNSGSSNGTIDFTTGGSTRMYITHDGHFLFSNDSSKLKFGTGNDFEIYHDGSYNYILSPNAHPLILEGDELQLRAVDNDKYLVGTHGEAVELYYNNSKKFETTNTGAAVTGNATISGSTTLTGPLIFTPVSRTISGGAITATASYHTIIGEGNNHDYLDVINGGTAGQFLTLKSENSTKEITVRDDSTANPGNIKLDGTTKVIMNYDTITLLYDGSMWCEIGLATDN